MLQRVDRAVKKEVMLRSCKQKLKGQWGTSNSHLLEIWNFRIQALMRRSLGAD